MRLGHLPFQFSPPKFAAPRHGAPPSTDDGKARRERMQAQVVQTITTILMQLCGTDLHRIRAAMLQGDLVTRVRTAPHWQTRPAWERNRFNLASIEMTAAGLRAVALPELQGVLPHHFGAAKWTQAGQPRVEYTRPAVAAALDAHLRRGSKSAQKFCAVLEKRLRTVNREDLAKADIGFGAPLGTAFFGSLAAVGHTFADLLVDALKHHGEVEIAEHFNRLASYHLRREGREVWANSLGTIDWALVKRALAEASYLCEQAHPGHPVTRERLIHQPLRYCGATMGLEVFNLISASLQDWRDLLPPGTVALTSVAGREVEARTRHRETFEKALHLNAKTTPADYIARALRAIQHGKIAPLGPTMVVDVLKHHPQFEIARYFRHLQPYHFSYGVDWQPPVRPRFLIIRSILEEALLFHAAEFSGVYPMPAEEAEFAIKPDVFCAAMDALLPRIGRMNLEGAQLRYGAKVSRNMFQFASRRGKSYRELVIDSLIHHSDVAVGKHAQRYTVEMLPIKPDAKKWRELFTQPSPDKRQG